MASNDYYVLSLKWTRRGDNVTWWMPNASGYTTVLENAGKYTEEDVKRRPGYLNDGQNTVAIRCDTVDKFASRVVLQEASHSLLTAAFGKDLSMVGSTVDDEDHEGRHECPHCERGFGHPGPSRLLHHQAKAG